MRSFGVVILVTIFFSSTPTYGQQSWIKTYGGDAWDFGHSVQQSLDGGYIITGRTMSAGAGGEDLYLIKINANGDTIWSKTYGGANSDGGCCVQKTSDSGYIIVGRTLSFGAGYVDVWLLKTDSLGDTLWTKTYGTPNEDWGYYGQQTMDGGYIIIGYQMFSPGEGDVWLIKTDEFGNELWTNTFGGSNYDEARAVAQTPDGGYIICGTDNFNTPNSELYLIKTDSLGSEEWSKHYGGPMMDYGLGVSLTMDGGYIIAGKKNIPGVAGEAYIVRTNSNGDTLWTRTFGDSADDYAHCARQTSDGGYVVVGAVTNLQTYYSNGYLIRLDTSGDSLWTKAYGDTNYANFFSVQETQDSGFICVGSIYTNDDYDVYAAKTDADGIVGIEETEELIITDRSQGLSISPNPFRERTDISFSMGQSAQSMVLRIFDITGRSVRSFPVNNLCNPDKSVVSVCWDAKDDKGHRVPAGVYFVRFETGNFKKVEKVILMR